MKKILSILLAALLLGGVMSVGLSAAAAPATQAVDDQLVKFLGSADLKNLTKDQMNLLVEILGYLKLLGFDYTKLLDAVKDQLPIAAKAALHKAGLMSYPVWERNVFVNLIFKYLLFGWIWM